MNENLVTLVVTRDSMTQDAGGGFVPGAPTAVYNGPAKFFPALLRSSEQRDESDAGIQTIDFRYFKFVKPLAFTAPATEFLPQDVATLSGGATYRITRVWEYAKSSQVEAFRLR